MKSTTRFLIIAGLMALTGSVQAQSTPKTLFVIVDGISSDALEKVLCPNLEAIAKAGPFGYARAYVGGGKGTYSQTPTISAVGYNSLLTGTWVNKHNVWDNSIKAPNYHYWTIFRYFHEQYPAARTAVFSTWLDNRTKLVGENMPETNHLRLSYHFDGFELDTVNFPHDKDKQYIRQIDERVVNEATRYISEQAPDLSWVYLEYTDDMGHRYGDSEQFTKAIQLMDDQMGRLWKAVEYRRKEFKEDWLVVITTDHGRDAVAGKNHGGQSDRERNTWIVTNAGDLNVNFRRSGEDKPAIVDIMPTIARHMRVTIPKEQAFEVDGVPLTGPLSLIKPVVRKTDTQIEVSWLPVGPEGNVKIWLTTTNLFEEGKQDLYRLMAEVRVTAGKATIDVSKLPSKFYKIVLEGRHNTMNRWIVE